ncbi:TBC1 domain family member 12 isoform X2 [Rhinatrema bivittatum]|uniref:TBC1 domain family member 12 isoform X2 n=1 Tax=Rhinatrema bivittatum TaxID=194408 RepID=UPI00112EED7F|nr:TBC1 domain family member 12 isoform X2 [Rhinatrema bivittatum]
MVGPEDAGGRVAPALVCSTKERAELRMVGGCSHEEKQRLAGGSVERGPPCPTLQVKAALPGCRSGDQGRPKSALLGGPADGKITNGEVEYWRAEEYEPELAAAGQQQREEGKVPNGGFLGPSTCCLLTQEVNANSDQHKCCFPALEVQRMGWSRREAVAQGPGGRSCLGAEDGTHPEKPGTSSETLQGCAKASQDSLLLNKVHAALSAGTEENVLSQGNASEPSDLRTKDRGSSSSASSSPSPVSARAVSAYFVSADINRITFMDVNLNSRNTFEVSRRQSAPENLPDGLTLSGDPSSDSGTKPKKPGFADFFTRNFFSKKTKELNPHVHSAPGWKLFGKVPPRENLQKDSKIIQQEYEARTGKTHKLPPHSIRRKNYEFEPLSTTALILEDRPANLPAKSVEEALRHRQEYDEMVAEAKKREIKEAQKRKKIMKERFKQEENIASAMVIWNTEILPNWENIRNTRKVRELWWQGLPPSVRGKVWSLAIGNELNITPELYEIFLSRAKERWRSFSDTGSENDAEDAGVSVADREASLELIKLDISRTFPSLYIFQKGGPYHDLLHSVLGAYTCYRPDVGYVQGMSFIAAVLILNLEEADAFIAFANLLNKPCQLAFFRVDHSMMLKYFATFEIFFEENLTKLFLHFKAYCLTPDIYLIDWIFTLYSKSLPLDLACRVWDVFCRDGEEFLFRTALGILRLYEDILLQMDFIHIAQFLTKLPEDITSEKLFICIAAIQMQNNNKKWAQVFTSLMKDNKEGDKNPSPALKS